ncbi:MAG: ATP-binding protein [Rhodospirillaceae bacterium]
MQQVELEVQADFIERLANAKPIQALSELIWNAFDADAHDVRVECDRDASGLLQRIRVTDDGHGIPLADAPALFKNLGGSWKRQRKVSLVESRSLHGEEGKGRFRALALGRHVEWRVTVAPDDDSVQAPTRYTITISWDNPRRAVISDPVTVPGARAGVEVTIHDLVKQWQIEDNEPLLNEITETVALYLTSYRQVRLAVAGIRVDAAADIAARRTYDLSPISVPGNPWVRLDVIEWKSDKDRALHLCTEAGFPVGRLPANVIAPGFSFTAYLQSPYITTLTEENVVGLAEMVPEVTASVEEARAVLKDHFKSRAADRVKDFVRGWKSEHAYPYDEEPKTKVEEVQRQVFDVVAVSVATALPDIQTSEQRTRKFQLRMLRQAIERGPEELQLIMTEVLQLPQRKREELARLLEHTSLSNIISASKLVADRLEFLDGLQQMLFRTDLKASFKERKQLHRILASNTWLFGEEYNLTVSDKDLTEVLRKHRLAGGLKDGLVDDEPVIRPDGTPKERRRGIVDLVLSRRIPTPYASELHHLVIELKAPKKALAAEDTQQIKSYAYAVSDDERFKGVKATWTFWLVGNDLSTFVERELNNGETRGILQRADTHDGTLTIHVRRWSELIHEARSRLEFVQKELNFEVNREEALAQLRSTYAAILGGEPGTVPSDEEPSDEAEVEET